MERRWRLWNAAEMAQVACQCRKIALYGIYFDTDKELFARFPATLQEINQAAEVDAGPERPHRRPYR